MTKPPRRPHPLKVNPLSFAREPLTQPWRARRTKHWAFGRRRFHSLTVNQLIDNGEAIRIGIMRGLNRATTFATIIGESGSSKGINENGFPALALVSISRVRAKGLQSMSY
jgi:hypothetical protein